MRPICFWKFADRWPLIDFKHRFGIRKRKKYAPSYHSWERVNNQRSQVSRCLWKSTVFNPHEKGHRQSTQTHLAAGTQVISYMQLIPITVSTVTKALIWVHYLMYRLVSDVKLLIIREWGEKCDKLVSSLMIPIVFFFRKWCFDKYIDTLIVKQLTVII